MLPQICNYYEKLRKRSKIFANYVIKCQIRYGQKKHIILYMLNNLSNKEKTISQINETKYHGHNIEYISLNKFKNISISILYRIRRMIARLKIIIVTKAFYYQISIKR